MQYRLCPRRLLKKPFSLIFLAKLPAERWTFTVDRYTIVLCVRGPFHGLPAHERSQFHKNCFPLRFQPGYRNVPLYAGRFSFTFTPHAFPVAVCTCFICVSPGYSESILHAGGKGLMETVPSGNQQTRHAFRPVVHLSVTVRQSAGTQRV